MTVFGSKSECFKCGTKQGGSGNSGKVGAASTIVGTASLSKSDRALIRDLMADSAATGSVSASSPTTTTSMGTNHAKNVHKQLRGMGFHEQDLARAIEMCGGLSTIEGSLNWLLLHCPEERVPKDLATTGGDSRSVIQRARKRRNQKKAAPKKKRKAAPESSGVPSMKLAEHVEDEAKKNEMDDLFASMQAEAAPKPKKKKVASAEGAKKDGAKKGSSSGGWG